MNVKLNHISWPIIKPKSITPLVIAYLSSKKVITVPQKIPGSFSDNFWETNKDKPTLRK